MKLFNKVAVITGAANGIGRTVAVMMAREGAKVVIADIRDEEGQAAVAEIKAGQGAALFVHCDVGVEADVRQLIEQTAEQFDRIDILVNNAAVAIDGRVTAMEETDWNKVLNTNLSSVYRGCKHAIPHMQKSGGGAIVSMSSVHLKVDGALTLKP